MTNKLFIFGIVTALCVSSVRVQAQGNASLANSGGAEAASDIGKSANFDQLLNKQTGSMHFYGKVTIPGAELPWDPVPVVVVCNEVIKFSTFASTKGDFDIAAPTRESEIVTDKQDKKRIVPSDLVGCTVKAVLDGFQSSTLTIANRSLEDDPSIGTITLRTDERALGSIYSPTTAAAPAEARKECQKARSDDLEGKRDSARRHLQKAVSIDPQFAEAWYHLGKLEATDKPQDALAAVQKAVAADPAYISPYEQIAEICATQKNWREVVDATDKALKLNPAGSPQIWYYNAVGNLNLGHHDVAEESAKKSLAIDPSHIAPNTEQLLAVILAGRGDYGEALEHLRHCLTYTPPGPNADLMKQQVVQLEKVVPKATQ